MTTSIDDLEDMDAEALRAIWFKEFSRLPPPRASEGYMHSVLAYRFQEQVGPKLSAAIRRRLEQLAGSFERDPNHRPAPVTRMKEGMRLLREWNGITHEVMVLETGFEYCGQRHRSLSAIAREITGTRWSGPAFFGLKEKANAA